MVYTIVEKRAKIQQKNCFNFSFPIQNVGL